MNLKRIIKKIIYSNGLFEGVYTTICHMSRGGVQLIFKGYGRIKKDCIGINNIIAIDECSEIHKPEIFIRGNGNKLIIGKNCIVGPRCSFRMEGDNITIEIGDRTTFTRDVQLCAQENESNIWVGEDVMFSNTIIVRTSDSHPIYNEEGKRINPPANVKIGNHVWISPNSKIFKGVTVGDGAIIGSDSLVTKDIGGASLAVGHPAKIVKENITWTREQLY